MTETHARRRTISSAVGLGVGGTAFFLVLLDFATELGRTALSNGFYSGVYELQGRMFLEGRISIPEGSMGIEGFDRGGKTWMYFPPFPALLRLPVLMTTHEFDGRLTLVSMAVAWIVLAAMTTKLVWLVHERVTGSTEVSRTAAVLMSIFLAAATGGTFLTYDAALPWVYHEVYLWAVAASVGAVYWMVRIVVAPDWQAVRWCGAFALVAIGTRATEGWALCLVLLAIALWMRVRPAGPAHRAHWWGVLLAAAVPLGGSIALNLYKFGHVYLFPLQDQVWTDLNEHRREALAANGGDLTGTQFFPTSLVTYFRPDGIRFVDHFPWITVPAEPPDPLAGAFIDQAYRTGSVTSFMTLLLLLTVIAAVTVFGPWAPAGSRALRAPFVASVAITGGVMNYGYYATRYVSEFVPALVVGGAIGTSLLALWVQERRRVRVPVLAGAAALTTFAILAQVAIGISAAAYNQRGDRLLRFLGWQQDVTPEAQAALVTRTDTLPTGARTDGLVIRGDCDALFLGTGDRYEPWITVEERDTSWQIHPEGTLRPGTLVLGHIEHAVTHSDEDEGEGQEIRLEVDPDEGLRIVVDGVDDETESTWVEFPPQGYVQVSVRNRTDFGVYEVMMSPGGVVGYLRSTYFDDDWIHHPGELVRTQQPDAGSLGVRLEEAETLPLPFCSSLSARADASEG